MFPMKPRFIVIGLVAVTLVAVACGSAATALSPTSTPTAPNTLAPVPTVTPGTEPSSQSAVGAESPGASAPTPLPSPTASSASPSSPASTTASLSAPPAKGVSEIVRLLTPSVVHIQTEAVQLDAFNSPVPAGGVGTGQVIDNQGHILTNNHVIEGAERILVTMNDGRVFEAELIGGDAVLDLAVLAIDADRLVPIDIGSSAALQVGDQVTAIGHALDLPGGPTVTGGWVSALNRFISVSETVTMQHLIQTDAAINPGNSGGPLVNMKGELVGINTAKIETGEGIGFAIAIDPMLPVIDELIANGRIDRGFLGVSSISITRALAIGANLPVSSGAGVVSVVPGSPAELAGVKERDIIVSMAGQAITNVAELDSILIRYREGTLIEMEVFSPNPPKDGV